MPEYMLVGADEIVGADALDDDDDMEVGGDYELVGADDDDVEGLLGAYPRRRRRRRRLRKAHAGQLAVRKAEPNAAQEMVLGIQSASTVAAGASEVITFRPQVLFRGTRLIIPDAIAPFFTIDDIKIGNQSQFAASGAVPAAAFGESVNSSGRPNLVMKTAQVSQDIVMTITNRSGAAAQFRAALFGDAVY